jgi:predicted O-methyltransferase YrrM
MILDPGIATYLDALVPDRPAELAAMEAEAAASDFPIIGPASGQLCYLVARLIGARSVIALGSGICYSTAWFARAVRANGGGVVQLTVSDDDLSARARTHLGALCLADLVSFTVGEAVDALRRTPGPYDLIFCDIDKAGYPAALEVITRELRPGGVLIADNLLWSGRVLDAADTSPDTLGIKAFTSLVMDNPAWTASIVPLRDGVLVARTVGEPTAAV